MEAYTTILNEASFEYEDRKSVFISTAMPVKTEAEALEFLSYIKKKYPDARHHVYAYVLRENSIMRFSDDREPQGTAGMPTLDAIRKSGACDICVVVTRYFGGILLGAGGLVRAYSKAAAEAVAAAGIVTYETFAEVQIDCTYSDYPKISNELPKFGAIIDSCDFGAEVSLKFAVKEGIFPDLCKKIAEMTAGRIEPKLIGTRFDCER